MKWILAVCVAVALVLLAVAPAGAVVHEQVGAFCSGGGVGVIGADGFLEPPGISDQSKGNFAQPVLSNGAVVITGSGPVIGNSPAAKFEPGTSVFALNPADSTSPATHCQAITPGP